ncbi:hypothetical protein DSO57_1005241 [Entomophthora muscae]|uniref:Uncharacterized protein n=1 Tax=Entomophthora muscae TaxID=34485 RepID=A0ACC2U6H8_9FUNG|nr:hypothetical protein DSO57_1005241 [Entomophthora muscae]
MVPFSLTDCVNLAASFVKVGSSDITPYTNQLSPVSKPLHLSSLVYWPFKDNFTKTFLTLAKEMGPEYTAKCKKYICQFSEQFYYSAGREVISPPMACYENELCFVQILWNQDHWETLPVIKSIGPFNYREAAENVGVRSHFNKETISYSFYGPGEYIVLFNKIQHASTLHLFTRGLPPKPEHTRVCNLKLNGTQAGVFGIQVRTLAPPI